MNGFIWRAEQLALIGLLVGTLLLLALYSRIVPPLEGFDADAHYLAAVHLRATGELPLLEREMVAVSYELVVQPLLYHTLAALAISPWPAEPTQSLAVASVNPYFDKSMSLRQMLVLPPADPIASPIATVPIRMAAAVSMLGGLLTVYGTWRLARALVPQQWSFALATAAIVGFNPVFLFLSVVVTNDAWAAGTIVLCVALAAEAALGHAPSRRWLWAGAWGGLATLAKYSGFLAGLPAAILWLAYLRRQGWAAAGKALLFAFGGGLVVAGWWFARMAWLYGELMPMRRIGEILGGFTRQPPLSWSATFDFAPWLVWSYWGVFVAVIAPAAFFSVVRWLMIGGLVGLLPALIRRDGASYSAKGWTLALALLWAGASAAAVLYWTRTAAYGEQGRLSHIGAPGLALLWVIGWQSFAPVRWRPLIHGGLTVVMVALALWQTQTLTRGFGLPAPIPDLLPDRQVTATFGNGPTLVGADFPNGATVAPGEPMPLTLYWTTDAIIPDHDTLFVHLADGDNRLLYQFDGVADQGRHPTRQWLPGEIFADSHLITVPAAAAPGLAILSVGFYPLEDINQRLEVTDGEGNVTGDRLVLAPIYVTETDSVPLPSPDAPLATWTNGITLAQGELVQDDVPNGLSLTWWSGATLHQDYTLFAQVLDGKNRILAQADLHGDRPTSTWRAGDSVLLVVTWQAAPGADLAEWQQVIVGWYDNAGVRLSLQEGGDYVVVATRSE
jgi:hypothetical protein